MSHVLIKDATGTGNTVKVDVNNRLHAQTVTQNRADEHCDTGDRYNVNTDDITLTSANESAILYLKNTGDEDIVIDASVYILGPSTGGSGSFQGYIYSNPTGGTIISNADAVGINANLNLSSSNTLAADIYKGAEGYTQTGGTKIISAIGNPPFTNVISIGKIIIPKTKSIVMTATPPSGNTSMLIHCAYLCYTERLNKEDI